MVKAVRYHGNQDIRTEEVDTRATLADGEIRLAPAWCGICGTDVHEYQHGPLFPPTKDKPHPLTGDCMPIILGHEFSGTVTEVSPSVNNVSVGDKVAVEGLLTDDTCYACSINRRNICQQSAFLGLSTNPGGLCESIVIPSSTVHRLSPTFSLEHAALVEPLSVAWNAVETSTIESKHSAIVFGAGPIGQAIILCLKAKGIKTIIASEPTKSRHAQAKALGATHSLNPTETDVVVKAKEICDGIGPDFSFDASGVQATLTSGLKAIRKYGVHYNVAVWAKDAAIDMNEILFNGKTVKGDLSYARGVYPTVIAAIDQGLIAQKDLDALITSRIELEDLEESGIKELINHKDKHIKILVRVDKSQPSPST